MELPPAVGSDGEGIGGNGSECQVFGEINREGLTIGAGAESGDECEPWRFDGCPAEVIQGDKIHRIPCPSYTIEGGADERTWVYNITETGPTKSNTRQISGNGVLLFRINATSETPWDGQSPFKKNNVSLATAAIMERRLAAEMGGPVGIAVTENFQRWLSKDQSEEAFDRRMGHINKTRGAAIALGGLTGFKNSVRMETTTSDYKPFIQRFGPNPPAIYPELRAQCFEHICLAAGVSKGLIMTQSKEAFRQFLHSTINPLAQQIASEMSVKLEDPELTLNMDKLMASDIFTRAKSYKLFLTSTV